LCKLIITTESSFINLLILQRIVTHDSMRYINILTYLLITLYGKQKLESTITQRYESLSYIKLLNTTNSDTHMTSNDVINTVNK